MGRFIDRLILWYSTLLAVILLGVFNGIQMGAGGLSIGAVITVAFGLSFSRQLLHASLATTVLRCVANICKLLTTMSNHNILPSISDEARGRLNALNVLSVRLIFSSSNKYNEPRSIRSSSAR
jgi:hypothetical protein